MSIYTPKWIAEENERIDRLLKAKRICCACGKAFREPGTRPHENQVERDQVLDDCCVTCAKDFV